MDILFLCAYASVCGIIIYWKIIRPWCATRHVRFLDSSTPSDIDTTHKAISEHGHPKGVGKQEWGIAHFESDDILCKRIERDEVVFAEPGAGSMFLKPEFGPGVTQDARHDNSCFVTAPVGLLQQRLAEIQSFCSIPHSKAEIERRFPGVEVASLRNLGILSEAGNIGRLGEYVWSGSKPEFISQQEDRSNRSTHQINDPARGRIDNLSHQTQTSGDNSRRPDHLMDDDTDWQNPS